ncbi:hypothetical protein [Saccharomonospora xinjiangensis]|nr:hypothetical protein [Saccharomonospora xinjiangensis]
MNTWCAAVDEFGGAVVVSLDGRPSELHWKARLADGRARGGFVGVA